MTVYVLLRASNKTGIVDTCMTGITSASMALWALTNTRPDDITLIIERDTGHITKCFTGTADGWPKEEDLKPDAHCTDMGISLEDLKSIKDERFD